MNDRALKTERSLKRAGFTFIELIIVVAIMLAVSAAVLFRQTQFSSDILITDMAYQIALSIRQAEVYGISSKGAPQLGQANGTSDADAYRSGYGVHFDPSLALGTDSLANGQSSYVTFIDPPDPGTVNTGEDSTFDFQYSDSATQRTGTISLTQGQVISKYCARQSQSPHQWECWSPTLDELSGPTRAMNIVFVKPNPEAHITASDQTSSSFVPENRTFDQAKIIIRSGLGDKCRSISVFASGQISVDAINADNPTGCTPPLSSA